MLSGEREKTLRYPFALAYCRRRIQKTLGKGANGVYPAERYHDIDSANVFIGRKIINGEPFAAARFGANELGILVSYLRGIRGCGIYSKNQMETFCNNAGFFPKEKAKLDDFAELMLDSLEQIDLLGVWNLFMEDYVVTHYMKKDIALCPLNALEPWSCKEKYWSQHLEGKRVLVVHPFSETIENQYQRREALFPGTNLLPEFTLETIKAVQTAAGQKDARFADWFEALDYMYEEVMSRQFDLAILGCGAYGFPLAAKIKQAGKSVVHLGGATQLMFGIKGKRWESKPKISQLFNDAWVRPNEGERPGASQSIENGCYW